MACWPARPAIHGSGGSCRIQDRDCGCSCSASCLNGSRTCGRRTTCCAKSFPGARTHSEGRGQGADWCAGSARTARAGSTNRSRNGRCKSANCGNFCRSGACTCSGRRYADCSRTGCGTGTCASRGAGAPTRTNGDSSRSTRTGGGSSASACTHGSAGTHARATSCCSHANTRADPSAGAGAASGRGARIDASGGEAG